jgi:hypothetical protein
MRPTPLPLDLREKPFSVRDARARGITADRLRSSDLAIPHRGVRSSRPAESLYERCLELLPLLRDDEFFAHVTALELWGLPVPGRLRGGDLHVAGSISRQKRRPGVVAHRYPSTVPEWRLARLPTAHPVEAWIESAPLLRLDDAVRLGDALAGSWSSWPVAREIEVVTLERAVESGRHRPGVATLRRAVELVRPGVESPKETELRLMLVRAGLPEPEVNVRRFADDGSYLGKPDLSYGWCKLALEYQGDHHRTDRATWRVDLARRERFEDAGWRVVLVSDDDLRGRAASTLVSRIRRHLDDHLRRAGTL